VERSRPHAHHGRRRDAKRRRLAIAWERITGPFTVLVLHAVVLWVWHVPALFESALHHESIHAFSTSVFF
jgi:putative membrane protein